MDWVLSSEPLSRERRYERLLDLVGIATASQLRSMLSDRDRVAGVVDVFSDATARAVDALVKIVEHVPMEGPRFLAITLMTLPRLEGRRAAKLAIRALDVALPQTLGKDRTGVIATLLAAAGGEINIDHVMRVALARDVAAQIASHNLVAIDAAPALRASLLRNPEVMANAILDRPSLDLSADAIRLAAALLWASEETNRQGFLRACARLLPFVISQTDRPASPLVAAAFPPIYKELRSERLLDILKFVFVFLDWDRCKSARGELVEAFDRSTWRASDIALTAARADDAFAILARVARGRRGSEAIAEIYRDVDLIPSPWRRTVKHALKNLSRRDTPEDFETSH